MTELFGSFRVTQLRRHALLRGAASAFDLRGDSARHYPCAATESQADRHAIRADWHQVEDDLRAALDLAAERRPIR